MGREYPKEVVLAALFHDAVLVPGLRENENRWNMVQKALVSIATSTGPSRRQQGMQELVPDSRVNATPPSPARKAWKTLPA